MNDLADRKANYESSNSSIVQMDDADSFVLDSGNDDEEFVAFRQAVLAKEIPRNAVKKILKQEQRCKHYHFGPNEHGDHLDINLEDSELLFKGDLEDTENEANEYESGEPTKKTTKTFNNTKTIPGNSDEDSTTLATSVKTTKTLMKLGKERKQNLCKPNELLRNVFDFYLFYVNRTSE
jgi:hypothetical protein